MDERTALIRDRAYQIWIDEGQPVDRHADHWSRAESEIDGEAPQETDKATAVGPAADVAEAPIVSQAGAGGSASPTPPGGDLGSSNSSRG